MVNKTAAASIVGAWLLVAACCGVVAAQPSLLTGTQPAPVVASTAASPATVAPAPGSIARVDDGAIMIAANGAIMTPGGGRPAFTHP